jgi:hypothetical protein
MGDTAKEIEDGLQTAGSMLPALFAIIPGLSFLQPYLPLLTVAIEAVEKIRQATGSSQSAAITQTASHLTPGMPNSPDLNETAPGPGTS